MKIAMQNKDTNRLSILRSLLSQTLNASKTASPINTDMQVLALLRKNVKQAEAASEEFRGAGRMDLVEKEEMQRGILEEYVGDVEVLGEDEIRAAARVVVEGMRGEANGERMQIGEVLKKVFAEGVLGGKPVEKGDVVKVVKQLLAEKP